ncbi:M48 family metallopeptidase [Reinekea marina]|uniref:M48 family metallopeptidase n=1 Tax=Reinekea marina TaxID=1310421 RepID=A0ABV7WX14_9GAMM|nr:M48 family metallopeptidase [Reinekea marina]MDN3648805.1 M48 family metallopeptidase [Reinekea marina]
MDFFEHQDKARKKTGQLVLLFCLGLLATLVAVNLVGFVAFWLITSPDVNVMSVTLPNVMNQPTPAQVNLTVSESGFGQAFQRWWQSNLNWQVSVGVLVVVLMGTVFRFLELQGGGRKVAEWAGATPVSKLAKDDDVTTYVNVSEEMAIAAGMPIPELYVMENEQGINAFVAGYQVDQAVMVVTKGALTQLTRDQLQGVIGHEYSHILNGDMRLNIRLMASLGGLILLGQVGRFFLESSLYSGRSRDNSKSQIAFIGVGAALMLVGYIGVLVGRMIKAAVSRQREYLADASSVQFTRNPDGIAGALYEIQKATDGSLLNHKHAEDMSHFCFGESVSLSQKLSTHPPIPDRIKRIDATFFARYRAKRRKEETAQESISRSAPDVFESTMAAASFATMVGQVTPDHVEYARNMHRHIPEQVKIWVHQSTGARSYIYCQVLLGSQGKQQAILNEIKQLDPEVVDTLQKMWPFARDMDEQLRLPLLEMSMPVLKRMTEQEQLVFIDRLEQLVTLDGRVDFVEWVTLSLTKLRLMPGSAKQHKHLSSKIDGYKTELDVLFRALVELNPNKEKAEQMRERVCARYQINYQQKELVEPIGFDTVAVALDKLDNVSFMWRKNILQACADIVESNGQIAFREYEALRVLAECLACPLPPLVMELSDVSSVELGAIEYKV